MMGKRIGIMAVSYGVLEQALHLPEGHRIAGLRLVDSFSDSFEIAVEGPSLLEVAENQAYPRVQFQITVTEGPELVPARTFVGKFA